MSHTSPVAGLFDVGPQQVATSRYVANVPFGSTFPSPPVVVATTLQGTNFPPPISDTFAVSIQSVSTTGFSASIYRVDVPNGGGWAQNLQLGWMAMLPTAPG